MKKVNILHNTNGAISTAYLLNALVDAIGDSAKCSLHHHDIKPGVWSKIKHFLVPDFSIWRDTARAQVLFIHTTVIFSLTQIIIAKLMRTKIVVIFWDAYPESFVSLGGWKNSVALRVYALLERRILRAADTVLLPSEDYTEHAQKIGLKNYIIMPLWPFSPIASPITVRKDPNALHIGFAGALNPIRGFADAIQSLGAAHAGKIVLHLYSSSKLETDARGLPKNIEIVEHGFVEQSLLVTELRQLDAGLVCLNPSFDLPAFPSKIVSYVSSGIPVIYSGPQSTGISSFLEKHRVGVCLSSSMPGDLENQLLSMKSDFTENQVNALSYLALTEGKLAQIL